MSAQELPRPLTDLLQTPAASIGQANNESDDKPENIAIDAAKRPAFDVEVIALGQASFEANCTQCHAADVALQKRKSLNGWRNTVRRMAARQGSSIPESDWEAISNYLTFANRGTDATAAETTAADRDADERFSVFATLSPTFRAGPGDVQNRGFVPELWLGIAFQPKGFVSGRATACVTCHNEPDEGLLNRIDLVEAAVRFDLMQLIEPQCRGGWRAAVDAGRFVVPFGAFSSQVNPGLFRTVSKPLIFNMGMRVFDAALGHPVLPMPYSDEGANLSFAVPLSDSINAQIDGYVVNGLQGNVGGVDFHRSDDYVDNNRSPAIGSRATIGSRNVRLGGSIMGGRFANYPNTSPLDAGLSYMIFGTDLTLRYHDLIRFQCEYAQRNNDRVLDPATYPVPDLTIDRESVGGGYVETEVLLSRRYKVSALVRYDNQFHHGLFAPPDSTLATGRFTVSRYTWGFNCTLPGGSLLMVNHEYWQVPHGLPNANVVGVRWAATF